MFCLQSSVQKRPQHPVLRRVPCQGERCSPFKVAQESGPSTRDWDHTCRVLAGGPVPQRRKPFSRFSFKQGTFCFTSLQKNVERFSCRQSVERAGPGLAGTATWRARNRDKVPRRLPAASGPGSETPLPDDPPSPPPTLSRLKGSSAPGSKQLEVLPET